MLKKDKIQSKNVKNNNNKKNNSKVKLQLKRAERI